MKSFNDSDKSTNLSVLIVNVTFVNITRVR